MWRAGLIILSVVLFGASSERLGASERPTISVARSAKGDLDHTLQAAAVEPSATGAESEEHFEWRSAAAYAAFEDIWTGLPAEQVSPVQARILASAVQDVESEWAFAPTSLMPAELPSQLSKAVPDRPDNASTRIYVLYGQYGVTT